MGVTNLLAASLGCSHGIGLPSQFGVLGSSSGGGGSSSTSPGNGSQYPALLNNYATRPSWKVAGVDYPAGLPQGTALTNPATLTLPGVNVNSTAQVIQVTTAGTTLEGIDFSQSGGWTVSITGAANVTI